MAKENVDMVQRLSSIFAMDFQIYMFRGDRQMTEIFVSMTEIFVCGTEVLSHAKMTETIRANDGGLTCVHQIRRLKTTAGWN